MELKDITINLELAKRLKELGVTKTSIFSYMYTTDRDDEPNLNFTNSFYNFGYHEFASAYTINELLAFIGQIDVEKRLDIRIDHYKYSGYQVYYINSKGEADEIPGKVDVKLSHALAKMLIYLLENKIIKL